MTLAMLSHFFRLAAGWMAVTLTTAALCLWALVVAPEAFHEGWYDRHLWRNALLTFSQYLGPALALFLPTLVAIRWRAIALLAFLLPAIASGLIFSGADRAGMAVALLFVGALFQFGRPVPRRWAWRVTLVLPTAIALIAAARPAYRSILQRPHPEDGQVCWSDMIWAPSKSDGGIEEHAALMVSVKLDGVAPQGIMQLDLGTPSIVVYPPAARWLQAYQDSGLRGTVAGRTFSEEPFGQFHMPEADLPDVPILLGTIGCTFFEHRILILDFVKQRLAILGKGAELPATVSSALAYVPLAYRYRHVFTAATIDGRRGPELIFDTGAYIPLFAGHQWWRELTHRQSDDLSNSTLRGSAWGQQLILIGAPMKGVLCVGSACLTNPVVYCEGSHLPNMDFDRYSFIASGAFGNVLFDRRFTVIVDISGRRLGLLNGSIEFRQN